MRACVETDRTRIFCFVSPIFGKQNARGSISHHLPFHILNFESSNIVSLVNTSYLDYVFSIRVTQIVENSMMLYLSS